MTILTEGPKSGNGKQQKSTPVHQSQASKQRLPAAPGALQAWLYQMQAFWTDQLDAFTYEQWACELPDSEAF